MANLFHIVNGDAVVPILKKSGIEGEIIVWREMLSDGPLDLEVASDEFWKKRYAFFEKELHISKIDYFDKTIKEILKVDDLPIDAEVVMWFEFDLFCQVNLMALCAFLLQNYRKDISYNLVCTGKVKGKEKLQSLTNFTDEEFKILYENKLKITRDNLLFAETCWKIFATNNFEEIATFNFAKKSKFKYFQMAMNQHLKRFSKENTLNEIDFNILKIINLAGLTKNEIIQKILIWQNQETIYGFGDLQYFLYLDKLKNYYEINNELYFLNEKGKSLIRN